MLRISSTNLASGNFLCTFCKRWRRDGKKFQVMSFRRDLEGRYITSCQNTIKWSMTRFPYLSNIRRTSIYVNCIDEKYRKKKARESASQNKLTFSRQEGRSKAMTLQNYNVSLDQNNSEREDRKQIHSGKAKSLTSFSDRQLMSRRTAAKHAKTSGEDSLAARSKKIVQQSDMNKLKTIEQIGKTMKFQSSNYKLLNNQELEKPMSEMNRLRMKVNQLGRNEVAWDKVVTDKADNAFTQFQEMLQKPEQESLKQFLHEQDLKRKMKPKSIRRRSVNVFKVSDPYVKQRLLKNKVNVEIYNQMHLLNEREPQCEFAEVQCGRKKLYIAFLEDSLPDPFAGGTLPNNDKPTTQSPQSRPPPPSAPSQPAKPKNSSKNFQGKLLRMSPTQLAKMTPEKIVRMLQNRPEKREKFVKMIQEFPKGRVNQTRSISGNKAVKFKIPQKDKDLKVTVNLKKHLSDMSSTSPTVEFERKTEKGVVGETMKFQIQKMEKYWFPTNNGKIKIEYLTGVLSTIKNKIKEEIPKLLKPGVIPDSGKLVYFEKQDDGYPPSPMIQPKPEDSFTEQPEDEKKKSIMQKVKLLNIRKDTKNESDIKKDAEKKYLFKMPSKKKRQVANDLANQKNPEINLGKWNSSQSFTKAENRGIAEVNDVDPISNVSKMQVNRVKDQSTKEEKEDLAAENYIAFGTLLTKDAEAREAPNRQKKAASAQNLQPQTEAIVNMEKTSVFSIEQLPRRDITKSVIQTINDEKMPLPKPKVPKPVWQEIEKISKEKEAEKLRKPPPQPVDQFFSQASRVKKAAEVGHEPSQTQNDVQNIPQTSQQEMQQAPTSQFTSINGPQEAQSSVSQSSNIQGYQEIPYNSSYQHTAGSGKIPENYQQFGQSAKWEATSPQVAHSKHPQSAQIEIPVQLTPIEKIQNLGTTTQSVSEIPLMTPIIPSQMEASQSVQYYDINQQQLQTSYPNQITDQSQVSQSATSIIQGQNQDKSFQPFAQSPTLQNHQESQNNFNQSVPSQTSVNFSQQNLHNSLPNQPQEQLIGHQKSQIITVQKQAIEDGKRQETQLRTEAEAHQKFQRQEVQRQTENESQKEANYRAQAKAEKEAVRQAHARVEAEKEAQRQAQARARAQQEAQRQTQARVEAEKEVQRQAQARIEAEKEAQRQAQARLEAEKEAQRQAQARAEAEQEAQRQIQARIIAQQEVQKQAQARAEAEQEAQRQAQARAEAQQEAERQAQAQAQTQSKVETQERAQGIAQTQEQHQLEEQQQSQSHKQDFYYPDFMKPKQKTDKPESTIAKFTSMFQREPSIIPIKVEIPPIYMDKDIQMYEEVKDIGYKFQAYEQLNEADPKPSTVTGPLQEESVSKNWDVYEKQKNEQKIPNLRKMVRANSMNANVVHSFIIESDTLGECYSASKEVQEFTPRTAVEYNFKYDQEPELRTFENVVAQNFMKADDMDVIELQKDQKYSKYKTKLKQNFPPKSGDIQNGNRNQITHNVRYVNVRSDAHGNCLACECNDVTESVSTIDQFPSSGYTYQVEGQVTPLQEAYLSYHPPESTFVPVSQQEVRYQSTITPTRTLEDDVDTVTTTRTVQPSEAAAIMIACDETTGPTAVSKMKSATLSKPAKPTKTTSNVRLNTPSTTLQPKRDATFKSSATASSVGQPATIDDIPSYIPDEILSLGISEKIIVKDEIKTIDESEENAGKHKDVTNSKKSTNSEMDAKVNENLMQKLKDELSIKLKDEWKVKLFDELTEKIKPVIELQLTPDNSKGQLFLEKFKEVEKKQAQLETKDWNVALKEELKELKEEMKKMKLKDELKQELKNELKGELSLEKDIQRVSKSLTIAPCTDNTVPTCKALVPRIEENALEKYTNNEIANGITKSDPYVKNEERQVIVMKSSDFIRKEDDKELITVMDKSDDKTHHIRTKDHPYLPKIPFSPSQPPSPETKPKNNDHPYLPNFDTKPQKIPEKQPQYTQEPQPAPEPAPEPIPYQPQQHPYYKQPNEPQILPGVHPQIQPQHLPQRPTTQPHYHEPHTQPSYQPKTQPVHPTQTPHTQPYYPPQHPQTQPSHQPQTHPQTQPSHRPQTHPQTQPSQRPQIHPQQPRTQPQPTQKPDQPKTQPKYGNQHTSGQPKSSGSSQKQKPRPINPYYPSSYLIEEQDWNQMYGATEKINAEIPKVQPDDFFLPIEEDFRPTPEEIDINIQEDQKRAKKFEKKEKDINQFGVDKLDNKTTKKVEEKKEVRKGSISVSQEPNYDKLQKIKDDYEKLKVTKKDEYEGLKADKQGRVKLTEGTLINKEVKKVLLESTINAEDQTSENKNTETKKNNFKKSDEKNEKEGKEDKKKDGKWLEIKMKEETSGANKKEDDKKEMEMKKKDEQKDVEAKKKEGEKKDTEEQKKEDEKKGIEVKKKEEENKQIEMKKKEEENKQIEMKKKEEEKKEIELKKKEEEKKQMELKKKEEEKKQMELKKKEEEKKQMELKKKEEEKKEMELKKKEEEKKQVEMKKKEEEKKQVEMKKKDEEKNQVEMKKKEEEKKQVEMKKKDEEKNQVEMKKKEEEKKQTETKKKEEEKKQIEMKKKGEEEQIEMNKKEEKKELELKKKTEEAEKKELDLKKKEEELKRKEKELIAKEEQTKRKEIELAERRKKEMAQKALEDKMAAEAKRILEERRMMELQKEMEEKKEKERKELEAKQEEQRIEQDKLRRLKAQREIETQWALERERLEKEKNAMRQKLEEEIRRRKPLVFGYGVSEPEPPKVEASTPVIQIPKDKKPEDSKDKEADDKKIRLPGQQSGTDKKTEDRTDEIVDILIKSGTKNDKIGPVLTKKLKSILEEKAAKANLINEKKAAEEKKKQEDKKSEDVSRRPVSKIDEERISELGKRRSNLSDWEKEIGDKTSSMLHPSSTENVDIRTGKPKGDEKSTKQNEGKPDESPKMVPKKREDETEKSPKMGYEAGDRYHDLHPNVTHDDPPAGDAGGSSNTPLMIGASFTNLNLEQYNNTDCIDFFSVGIRSQPFNLYLNQGEGNEFFNRQPTMEDQSCEENSFDYIDFYKRDSTSKENEGVIKKLTASDEYQKEEDGSRSEVIGFDSRPHGIIAKMNDEIMSYCQRANDLDEVQFKQGVSKSIHSLAKQGKDKFNTPNIKHLHNQNISEQSKLGEKQTNADAKGILPPPQTPTASKKNSPTSQEDTVKYYQIANSAFDSADEAEFYKRQAAVQGKNVSSAELASQIEARNDWGNKSTNSTRQEKLLNQFDAVNNNRTADSAISKKDVNVGERVMDSTEFPEIWKSYKNNKSTPVEMVQTKLNQDTEEQIKKYYENYPNWTKDVEERNNNSESKKITEDYSAVGQYYISPELVDMQVNTVVPRIQSVKVLKIIFEEDKQFSAESSKEQELRAYVDLLKNIIMHEQNEKNKIPIMYVEPKTEMFDMNLYVQLLKMAWINGKNEISQSQADRISGSCINTQNLKLGSFIELLKRTISNAEKELQTELSKERQKPTTENELMTSYLQLLRKAVDSAEVVIKEKSSSSGVDDKKDTGEADFDSFLSVLKDAIRNSEKQSIPNRLDQPNLDTAITKPQPHERGGVLQNLKRHISIGNADYDKMQVSKDLLDDIKMAAKSRNDSVRRSGKIDEGKRSSKHKDEDNEEEESKGKRKMAKGDEKEHEIVNKEKPSKREEKSAAGAGEKIDADKKEVAEMDEVEKEKTDEVDRIMENFKMDTTEGEEVEEARAVGEDDLPPKNNSRESKRDISREGLRNEKPSEKKRTAVKAMPQRDNSTKEFRDSKRKSSKTKLEELEEKIRRREMEDQKPKMSSDMSPEDHTEVKDYNPEDLKVLDVHFIADDMTTVQYVLSDKQMPGMEDMSSEAEGDIVMNASPVKEFTVREEPYDVEMVNLQQQVPTAQPKAIVNRKQLRNWKPEVINVEETVRAARTPIRASKYPRTILPDTLRVSAPVPVRTGESKEEPHDLVPVEPQPKKTAVGFVRQLKAKAEEMKTVLEESSFGEKVYLPNKRDSKGLGKAGWKKAGSNLTQKRDLQTLAPVMINELNLGALNRESRIPNRHIMKLLLGNRMHEESSGGQPVVSNELRNKIASAPYKKTTLVQSQKDMSAIKDKNEVRVERGMEEELSVEHMQSVAKKASELPCAVAVDPTIPLTQPEPTRTSQKSKFSWPRDDKTK